MLAAFRHVINFAATQIITNSIQKKLFKVLVAMMITFAPVHVTSSLTQRTLQSVTLNRNASQTRCFAIMISQNRPRLMISNVLESIKSVMESTYVQMAPMKLGRTVSTRIVTHVQKTW